MRSRRRSFRVVAAALGLAFALPALAQDVQERVIRFGHLNNPDHPVSLGAKRFADLVAHKSGGKLKVQEFPSSTLGNELQQQSALQKAVEELKAKGMQYNDLAPAELARMRTTAKAVTDRFLSTYDPAMVKLYGDELARIQK